MMATNGLRLSEADRAMLAGERGDAARLALRILLPMARIYGAEQLLDIEHAHVDGVLLHGESGLDFAERLLAAGGRVVVPTTLNVGAYDLLHPEIYQGDEQTAAQAQRLMQVYVEMGCEPIFTCAPYQSGARPPFGAQIAWAESNAIVFANSVLGARTQRYGDFIDICCALTARAPACGLHLTENRRGRWLFALQGIPPRLLMDSVLYPVLGYLVGAACGAQEGEGEAIPIITGLPPQTNEDQLKALGAAAASSGAVALFHAVGITPEANTLQDATQGKKPEQTIAVDLPALRRARDQLSTVDTAQLDVVALGSPHFSLEEFAALRPLLEHHPPHSDVDFIVCTHRIVLAALQQRGWLGPLKELGVRLVVDTCVVVAPLLRVQRGVLMTNSAKFAHYTPGNTGLGVVFGSLEECVRSAHEGRIWRDEALWQA
ncbi:MAG: aconitase X catalytic domain-containing protein [Anaerolineaceae bacterium]|nr:aconitase X catalytic domain-containing protein [Anaerolineaceae bacterium]MCY4008987.1 aconitase X catalytic domain-containing protein [Anaerolineaceae bacterium]MCY4105791.1 aconitase X catalytic domain-containing protein [Chloroflexota bacterium]